MLQEFGDTCRCSFVSIQPLHLPLRDSIPLFRLTAVGFGFVNPLILSHEYDWFFCALRELSEFFGLFVLGKSYIVIILAVQRFCASFRVGISPKECSA
jgi:hypothetical protein